MKKSNCFSKILLEMREHPCQFIQKPSINLISRQPTYRNTMYSSVSISSKLFPLEEDDFALILDMISSSEEDGCRVFREYEGYYRDFRANNLVYNSPYLFYKSVFHNLFGGTSSKKKRDMLIKWFGESMSLLDPYNKLIGSCESYVYHSQYRLDHLDVIDRHIQEEN